MKPSLSAKLAICILMLFGVSAIAQPGPQPFSADFSTTSSNGNAHINGKFYFSLPKMRFDMEDTGQRQAGPFGGKMSVIMDASAKMAYVLMHAQQMYMEMPLDQNNPMLQRMPKLQNLSSDPCSVGNQGDATCKKLGTETVNGRACDKWEVTDKSGKKETLWIDQKLHFPIKSTDGQTTSEFTNIKEGSPDASLFTLPPGYRKFDASMMGGQRPH